MAETNQDFEMWQGNNKKIEFSLNQTINGDYHNLHWYLAKSTTGGVLLEKNNIDSSHVTLNDTEDIITVYIMSEDTEDIEGNISYYHELVIKNTDTDETFTIATGRMKLYPTLSNNSYE